MNIRPLTATEHAAIVAFAKAHGRRWKSVLRDTYWYNARVWNDFNELHALRNDPRWSFDGLEQLKLTRSELAPF